MLLAQRSRLRRHACRFRYPTAHRLHLRQAEVQNLGVTTFGDEYVRRLNVSMNDAFRVRRIQGIGNFNRDREQRFEVHWTIVDQVFQGSAVQELHDDE